MNKRFWRITYTEIDKIPLSYKETNFTYLTIVLSPESQLRHEQCHTLMFDLRPEDLTYLKLLGLKLIEVSNPHFTKLFNEAFTKIND